MGWGSLLGKGIGLAIKHGPKAVKAFGQINDGAKKFGTIIDGGRKFGSLVNQVSGGKIGNSKFGRDISKLTDKAEQITNTVGSMAAKADGTVQNVSSVVSNAVSKM